MGIPPRRDRRFADSLLDEGVISEPVSAVGFFADYGISERCFELDLAQTAGQIPSEKKHLRFFGPTRAREGFLADVGISEQSFGIDLVPSWWPNRSLNQLFTKFLADTRVGFLLIFGISDRSFGRNLAPMVMV
jgi:hypothetical protein